MRFNTLNEWLSWQESLHPRDIELGLERAAGVWRRLRPAGLACPVVTVAGTNGKGSCVALLEAILRAAGYRTACYTSPHLLRYNERVRIDGQEVSDTQLCGAFERIDQARQGTSLTYFEFGTLAALDLFADAALDCAILEVGLGGRLDAVNILDTDLALITGVALDHMDWLGHDLDSIGREKAGICRPDSPAVIGQIRPPDGLLEAARARAGTVYLRDRDFSLRVDAPNWTWNGPRRSRAALPRPAMRAARQLDNAAAVLMALDCLSERLPVDQAAVREGLLSARLPGRLQVIPGPVDLILDVAHNPQAAGDLARDLASIPCKGRTHGVFGCFKDKDAAGIVQALAAEVDTWYLTSADSQRARSTADLEEVLRRAGITAPVQTRPAIDQALAGAREDCAPGDRILVTGSFLTVAAALDEIGGV